MARRISVTFSRDVHTGHLFFFCLRGIRSLRLRLNLIIGLYVNLYFIMG